MRIRITKFDLPRPKITTHEGKAKIRDGEWVESDITNPQVITLPYS